MHGSGDLKVRKLVLDAIVAPIPENMDHLLQKSSSLRCVRKLEVACV
jgi:hypothetical protein